MFTLNDDCFPFTDAYFLKNRLNHELVFLPEWSIAEFEGHGDAGAEAFVQSERPSFRYDEF